MTRLTARYATALVFAFSAAGAFTYAQIPPTDTLAGPTKELELPVPGCPKDYPNLVPVEGSKPRVAADANRDGFVCADRAGTEFVDNTIDGGGDPEPSGTRHVTGHGNFIDANIKKPDGLHQDLSFSFHGIGIDGLSGAEAKGKFEYHDQTPAGADLTVHGDVICLTVTGNTATLLGIVTRSNDDLGLSVNTVVVWKAQDNGEGNVALEADRVTRPSPTTGSKGCKFAQVKLDFREIISGNIQVDEDETAGGPPTEIGPKPVEEKDDDSWGTSGEGKFYDTGKKAGVLQDIAFKFTATGEGEYGKVIDGVAKGDFEYQDQTPGAMGLAVRGYVVCASVSAKSVTLIGVVSNSNDKGVPVDTLVAWKAQDNGNDAPGLISRLQPIGVKSAKGGLCSGKVPEMKLQSVTSGAVVVK